MILQEEVNYSNGTLQSSNGESKIIRRKAFSKNKQVTFGKNIKIRKNKRVYRKRSRIIKNKSMNTSKYYSKEKIEVENKNYSYMDSLPKNHLILKYPQEKNNNDRIYQVPYISLSTDSYGREWTTTNPKTIPHNYSKFNEFYEIPLFPDCTLDIRSNKKKINNIDIVSANQITYEPLYPASSFKGSVLSTHQNTEASILASDIDSNLLCKPWNNNNNSEITQTSSHSSNTYSLSQKDKNYFYDCLEEHKSKSLHPPRTVKAVKKLNFFNKQNSLQRTKSVDSTNSIASSGLSSGRGSIKSLKSLSETFLQTDKMVIVRENIQSENITSTLNLNEKENGKKKKPLKFLSFFMKKGSSKKIIPEDEGKKIIKNVVENKTLIEVNDKNEYDNKLSESKKEIFSFKTTFKESISSFKFNSRKKFRAPNPPECEDIVDKKNNLSISMPNVNEIIEEEKFKKINHSSEPFSTPPMMISKFKSVFKETKNTYQSTPDLRCDEENLVVCTLTNKDYKMTEEDMVVKLNLETVDKFLKVNSCDIRDKTTDEMIRGRMLSNVRSNNYTKDNNLQSLNSQILIKESPSISDSSEQLVREYNKLKILYEKLKKSVDSTQELTSQRSFNLQASIIEQHNVVKKLCEQVKLEKELKEKVTEGEISPMINPKNNYQIDKDGRLISNNTSYITSTSQLPECEFRNNSTTIRIDTFHMDTYSSNSILHHSNGKITSSNNDGNERIYDYNEKPKSVNYINNRYIDNTNHSKYLYSDKSFSKKDDTEKISKLWLGEENGKKIKNSTYSNKSPTSSKNNHYEKIKPFYNNRLEEEMRTQMEREMQHKEERKLVEEEVTSGTLKGNKNEKIVLVKKNILGSPKNDKKNVSSFDTTSSTNSIIINLTGENGYGKYDNAKNNIYNNHNTTPLSPKSTPSTSNTISSKNFLAPRKDLVILKSPTPLKVPLNSSSISNNLKSEKNFFQLDNKESVINQMKNTLRKVSPPIEKTGMTLGRVIDNIPQQKVSPSSKNSESGISSDSSPSTSPLPPPPLFNNNGTFINKTFKNFSTSTDNYKKSPDHENIGKPKNPPPPPPPTGLGIKKLPTDNFESLNKKNKNQNSKNEQLSRDDLLAEIRNFGGAARLKRQA